MKYEQKSFSSGENNKAFRDGWERMWGKPNAHQELLEKVVEARDAVIAQHVDAVTLKRTRDPVPNARVRTAAATTSPPVTR